MRMFPILYQGEQKSHDLKEIPWDMIAPFEKQAIKNHEQDLEELARRGGLNAQEALLILLERPLRDFWTTDWKTLDAVAAIKDGVKAWLEDQQSKQK